MSMLRRWAPGIVLGLSLVAMGEGVVNGWGQQMVQQMPLVSGLRPVAGGGCLQEAAVLALLQARDVEAVPEVPEFCAQPAGLTRWYALTPLGPDGTHIAFDSAGCLADWQPAQCPPS
jgi:hypothetical protein